MKKVSIVSIIILIVGVTAIGAVVFFSYKEAKRAKSIDQEIENLQKEADRVEKYNSDLRERITYFQTPEFQEKVAKEKLNLQKPDEQVVIVKPSPSREASAPAVSENQGESEKENIPNYLKWWNQFFKY